MRLLAAYCLMGTVAAPRGVPLSSSGPNINAAAMGDVQQPSRMSRWSKEVPSLHGVVAVRGATAVHPEAGIDQRPAFEITQDPQP